MSELHANNAALARPLRSPPREDGLGSSSAEGALALRVGAGLVRAETSDMTRAICCLATIALGCGRAAEVSTLPEPDELGSRHVTGARSGRAAGSAPADADRAKLRFRMQRYMDDLRTVERLLIAGRLDEARSRAFLLSRPARDVWSIDALRVSQAALALSGTTDLEEACRIEPRIAAACADCHRRAGSLPAFDRSPRPPPDDAEPRARMARHEWAADQLWEGLVGASDRSWTAGLEVLAVQPLPSLSNAAGPRLQRLAAAALAAVPRDTPADRARTYGELLVTCAACHGPPRSGPGDHAPPVRARALRSR